jgi:hypothetical protein
MTETTTEQATESTAKVTPTETGDGAKGSENGSSEQTIPKQRLDAEIAKRKAAEKAAAERDAELEEYRAAKAKAADDEAKRSGDVTAAQQERDKYKASAEQWEAYATDKLKNLTAGFDEDQQATLAIIEDAPLDKRLALAEKLATSKKTEPGFGSGGGPAKGEVAGAIPSNVTSMAEYHAWMAGLSRTPEGRATLKDRDKMDTVRAEARRKFNK